MGNSLTVGQVAAGERCQPAAAIGTMGARRTGDRPRILIVDGDPASVTSLRQFLASKGYEVLTAADGPEALQMVWENPPTPCSWRSRWGRAPRQPPRVGAGVVGARAEPS